MTVVNILVEGQTEEQFVSQSIAPALAQRGVYLRPIVITTKRRVSETNHRGGLSTFAKFESELKKVLRGTGPFHVSTFIDLYALPSDFPGFQPTGTGTPIDRAKRIEAALHEHFADQRLRPYVQVHEAESLVLACPDQIELRHPGTRARVVAAVNAAGGPEFVNDGPNTAPSKRLQQWAPAYVKATDGPAIVAQAGLSAIRGQCAHFSEWITWLESLA